jgi:hypothetical protein
LTVVRFTAGLGQLLRPEAGREPLTDKPKHGALRAPA